MIIILSIVGVLIIAYLLFTNFYPSFGGDVSKERKEIYKQSPQYGDNKFINSNDSVPKSLSFTETLNLAYYFFTTKVPNGRPKEDIIPKKTDSLAITSYKGASRMLWFGHSSFLLQIEGQTILLDPMFSKVPAPHPLLGANRFNKDFPVEIEKLPQIDAVIYSHDHYDHLDYESVLKIKDKVGHFYVPLGLGVHLEAWGVSNDNITEMDWWEETQFDSLLFACTPAQHFSGRKFGAEQSTLWSSWVIKGSNDTVFFSGDSGYSPHFKEIGEKYGPFNIALLECGQYNERWADIHMMPEETAQAGLDLKADKIMPIHWGGFKLALHEWTDPVVRVTKKASELNVNIITPQIGETIVVGDTLNSYSNWWEDLK